MRSLTLRRASLAALIPLALGSLAACGNDASSTVAEPQSDSVSSASGPSSTPLDSGTADSRDNGRAVDPAAFLDQLRTAAQAITTARFTMTMDLSGQTVEANGAIDLTGDQTAMQLSMDLTGMGTPTDLRIVEGVLYVQDPTSSSGRYLKMDLSDPNGPLAGMGDALDGYDPQSMIRKMSPDSFRKVTDLGAESVGGQQLEHYRVVLDTGAAGSMLQNLPSSASMPKAMMYDVWLDGHDRVARFKLLMKRVAQMTATYSDYGADLHIVPPDPSKVVQAPSASG
jgi:hypothetical protein